MRRSRLSPGLQVQTLKPETSRCKSSAPDRAGTGAALHYANQEHSPFVSRGEEEWLCHQQPQNKEPGLRLQTEAETDRAQQCRAPTEAAGKSRFLTSFE
jgi:hypothetical protein